jgi:hypothetical protein
MTRTPLFRIIAISTLIFATAVYSLADIRIRFAPGRTSATVSGRVANGGRVCYVAGAKSGQTLTATLSSATGKAQIFESGETSYSLKVEMPGDQSICVDNLGRATPYTLTVSIR